jgi:hypothetical protein
LKYEQEGSEMQVKQRPRAGYDLSLIVNPLRCRLAVLSKWHRQCILVRGQVTKWYRGAPTWLYLSTKSILMTDITTTT